MKQAQAAYDKTPDALSPLLHLADALVDQGCYREAVAVLEKGRVQHADSTELSGKLRDVGSMVAEESYIQGMTEAEDAARLQHSTLRCEKMSDLAACNEALKSTPEDTALLLAKADLLVQAGRAADAVPVYERAAQLNPANSAAHDKLAAAQALASNAAEPTGNAGTAAPAPPVPVHRPRRSPPVVARVNTVTPPEPAPAAVAPQSYSNEAPAGRSN